MSRRGPGPRHRGPRPAAATGRREHEDSLGGELVIGRHAVGELLEAGLRRVRDVWMAAGMDPSPSLDRITEAAAARGVAIRYVSREQIDARARAEGAQGVLAHAGGLPEADFDELCQAKGGPGDPLPLLLAVDGVTDPHNLGALLRTAEAAGATGAVLPRHRAARVTPVVTKAAAGAIERVPIAVVPGLPAALARAKDRGLWVVGLCADEGQDLYSAPVGGLPVLVAVGAEGTGLGRLVRQRCDLLLSIPLHGRIPSLNVGAAAAIALFEIARQRSVPS